MNLANLLIAMIQINLEQNLFWKNLKINLVSQPIKQRNNSKPKGFSFSNGTEILNLAGIMGGISSSCSTNTKGFN